jgi:hypothetical protein
MSMDSTNAHTHLHRVPCGSRRALPPLRGASMFTRCDSMDGGDSEMLWLMESGDTDTGYRWSHALTEATIGLYQFYFVCM